MTQLFFRHSYIYDNLLSKAEGQSYTPDEYQKGVDYANDFYAYWQQHNDKFFSYYKNLGFTFADFWMVYLIHPKTGFKNFSDPLTLTIKEDKEEVTCILIHELCHALQSYPDNQPLAEKLYNHIDTQFPEKGFDINIELVTVLLARGGIEHIFGKERLDKFSESEKSLTILKDVWKIIDSQPEVLNEKNPIEAILKIKKPA